MDINAVAPLTPNACLRHEVVERRLPAGVTDVLEVGCGQGALGVRLAQRYRGFTGIEVRQSGFRWATSWRPAAT